MYTPSWQSIESISSSNIVPVWLNNLHLWLMVQNLFYHRKRFDSTYFFIDAATLKTILAHLIRDYARKSMKIFNIENHWQQAKPLSSSAATFETFATLYIRDATFIISLLSIIKPKGRSRSTAWFCFTFSVEIRMSQRMSWESVRD